MKFKEGDWVICIENYRFPITIGKSYKIEYVSDSSITKYFIRSITSNGYWCEECEEYFKLDVVKMRKLKLKKLHETIL
jgi:hypothetical protein